MMKPWIRRLEFAALCVACALVTATAHAVDVAGVPVEESVKLEQGNAVLNGAGVRTKFFIKVYVAALYVGQKANTLAALTEANGARRMSLRLLRDLDADSLFDALKDGLQANHSAPEMQGLKPQVDQLGEIMKKIGNGKKGDVIDIDLAPDTVTIAINGEARGKVSGIGFNKAMLKIWLGDNPVDGALKKALLGA